VSQRPRSLGPARREPAARGVIALLSTGSEDDGEIIHVAAAVHAMGA